MTDKFNLSNTVVPAVRIITVVLDGTPTLLWDKLSVAQKAEVSGLAIRQVDVFADTGPVKISHKADQSVDARTLATGDEKAFAVTDALLKLYASGAGATITITISAVA